MRIAVGISIFLWTLISSAIACSCLDLPASPQEHLDKSEVVFVGTALETMDTSIRALYSTRKTTFQIVEQLKGEHTETIEIYHDEGFGNCGVSFQKGEVYRVFAGTYYNRFITSQCHLTVSGCVDHEWSWEEYREAAKQH